MKIISLRDSTLMTLYESAGAKETAVEVALRNFLALSTIISSDSMKYY